MCGHGAANLIHETMNTVDSDEYERCVCVGVCVSNSLLFSNDKIQLIGIPGAGHKPNQRSEIN